MVFARRDSNKILNRSLCIELHERLIPFPIRFLNVFFGIFKKATVFAPGQIKFPINNLERLGFYAGSPAER